MVYFFSGKKVQTSTILQNSLSEHVDDVDMYEMNALPMKSLAQ